MNALDVAKWLRENSDKQGTPEFAKVLNAFKILDREERQAEESKTLQPSGVPGGTVGEQRMAAESEIPMLDTAGNVITPLQAAREPEQDPEFRDKLLGAAEVLTTLATGATTGAGGQVRGTLAGLAEQILAGQFGTPEAAQLIQQKAMETGAEYTYMPKTQVGQEYLQAVSEPLESLPAYIPAMGSAGTISTALSGARQAARAGGAPEVAQMTGQAVREVGPAAMDIVVPQPVRAAVQPVVQAAVEPVKQTAAAVSAQMDRMQQQKTMQTRSILESEPDRADVVEFQIVNDRVRPDQPASDALKQGWDAAVLGSVKASSDLDRRQMEKSLRIHKLGKRSASFAAKNRPSDVIGESMMKRVNFLINEKTKSGKQIDNIAKTQLPGKPVNYEQPMEQFVSDLADIGVSVERGGNGKFKVDLQGSDIEGDRAGAALLNRVLERLGDTKVPDAYDVHRAKRYIDTQVSYGKRRVNPLTAEAEYIVKSLRRNLNTALGDEFPQYRQANTRFSDSLTALDQIQDAVGKKVNFESDRSNAAFGTALRKVLTNYGSRNSIIDAIDGVEMIAKKYGLKVEDDLMSQIIFVNEIDRMFGAAATGSFKGQIEQALRKGSDFARSSAVEKVVTLAGKAGEAVRGINEENAIKSIEEILKRRKPKQPGTELVEQ